MRILNIAVLFIIISIVTNILEGAKKSKNAKHKKQKNYQPSITKNKSIINKTPIEVKLEEKAEGRLFEDKNVSGSLTYVEVDEPDEGIQTEPSRAESIKTEEKPIEVEESKTSILDFSNLQRSIVLTEVLGPPRALKKRIR